MNTKYLLWVCFALLVISCRKGTGPADAPKQPDPLPADIPSVQLKDMSVSSLPSPHYHFSYNDSGYITQVSHASGLTFYDISYTGGKISKIETNKDLPFDINKDRLEYEYSNGYPVVIRVTDKNGVFYRKCSLTFQPSHQLQKLTWEVNMGTGFTLEQTLEFSYYPDSNLKEIAFHDYPVGPQTELIYTNRFENYDNKVNADGFSLLHTHLHHPIFLPAIKLQLNNPGKDIRTGTKTLSYEANYTYTYDSAGRPLVKSGPIKWTAPQGGSGEFQSVTTFSYY